jgi:hypothetical protein
MNVTCWKCKAEIPCDFNYCCHCGNKLKNSSALPLPETTKDILFLKDLYNFGWYNRYDTAVSLYESVFNISDIQLKYNAFSDPSRFQRILVAKIFCEYMGLLESTGMLLLSISRRNSVSFSWSYSHTEPYEVTQFYLRIKNIKRLNVGKLLNFPTITVIEEAAKAVGLSAYEQKTLKDSYRNIASNLKLLADQYLNKDGLLVRYYNKLKHGFSIIEGEWVQPPLESDKIAIYTHDGVGYLSPKQDNVLQQIENIRNITLIGAEMIATCLALNKINALYL